MNQKEEIKKLKNNQIVILVMIGLLVVAHFLALLKV